MSKLSSRASGEPAVGELLVLEDANSRVEVAPQRGGLVTSFQVDGRELLYLEPATLADASKNVRGGIPVLFPSPGKLRDDTFSYEGKRGALKQHGFARNLPWTVEGSTLTLEANAQTRAQFPWDFRYALTITLQGARLRLGIRVENPGVEPLPFGLGFHPYFVLRDKTAAKIDTQASTIFDNVTKEVRPFTGFDFTRKEQDLYLLDHGSTHSALHYGDGSRLEVRASPDFTRWVVWSLADKDYVCIEPWTSPPDALNTGEGLLRLAPGATHDAWVELELLRT
ncbi:MAG TPA: galactose mutarotase [Polyangiales bacterium]|nr:galactose mutarotase [Polyangiales bacterium]